MVVDSRPLEEGRNLLACLCENNIEAEYVHIYALDYAMQDATKVFLGANAVMLDAALYSERLWWHWQLRQRRYLCSCCVRR